MFPHWDTYPLPKPYFLGKSPRVWAPPHPHSKSRDSLHLKALGWGSTIQSVGVPWVESGPTFWTSRFPFSPRPKEEPHLTFSVYSPSHHTQLLAGTSSSLGWGF